jgi:uncharacterized glyoxalase superfamily protein PhnB
VFGSGKPWRGPSSPHSCVMCIDGNVMTVLSKGPCSRRSQLTDQKCSTKRAVAAEGQIAAPDPTAPATHSVAFYCEDADAVVTKAEQAGATIREPAQTFVTGDRFASILDPFGQRWTVMTRVKDVSPEERDRRMAEWAKENVGS